MDREVLEEGSWTAARKRISAGDGLSPFYFFFLRSPRCLFVLSFFRLVLHTTAKRTNTEFFPSGQDVVVGEGVFPRPSHQWHCIAPTQICLNAASCMARVHLRLAFGGSLINQRLFCYVEVLLEKSEPKNVFALWNFSGGRGRSRTIVCLDFAYWMNSCVREL